MFLSTSLIHHLKTLVCQTKESLFIENLMKTLEVAARSANITAMSLFPFPQNSYDTEAAAAGSISERISSNTSSVLSWEVLVAIIQSSYSGTLNQMMNLNKFLISINDK